MLFLLRKRVAYFSLSLFACVQLWTGAHALLKQSVVSTTSGQWQVARRDEIIDGTLHASSWRASAFLQSTNRHTNTAALPAPVPLTNIQWLHVPKTGTSFIGSIWTYACGRGDPPLDIEVDARASPNCEACYDFALMQRYPQDAYCSQGILHPRFQTQHRGLNATDLDAGASYVGFLRKPNQRMISAFKAARHASGLSKETALALKEKCAHKDAGCFARFPGIAGCMTRMLAGSSCAADQRTHAAGELSAMDLVPTALNHLRRMAFIGLTDRWDESVCLFHLMYGQRLYVTEFKDEHHSKFATGSQWDEAELHGFVDQADEQIYAAAEARFDELVHQHTAGRGSACEVLGWTDEQPAPKAAAALAGAHPAVVSAASTHSLVVVESGKCSKENAECGRTADVDCGVCPAPRLEFRSKLQSGVSCNARNKCEVNGKEDHQLYGWRIDSAVIQNLKRRRR